MTSLADEILSIDDRPRVAVKAWGKTLYVQPMSGEERDAYDLEIHRAKKDGEGGEDMANWRARLLVRCLYDEGANRVFTDDQAAALGKKRGETIRRLFEVATDVNEIGPDAVADAAKNSCGGASDSTGSASLQI